jgi:mono/diheme cytochrome c family protein
MESENDKQQLDHAKKTKRYVAFALVFMFVLSVVVAWTMSQNYKKEGTKERYRLTKLYKDYKKKNYVYSNEKGSELYLKYCLECHRGDGLGVINRYPPLKGSEIVDGNFQIPLHIILHGLQGAIERNGIQYHEKMPGFKKLHPEDLAHILNYIRRKFGSLSGDVHPVEVIKTQVKTIDRKKAYTEDQLGTIKD